VATPSKRWGVASAITGGTMRGGDLDHERSVGEVGGRAAPKEMRQSDDQKQWWTMVEKVAGHALRNPFLHLVEREKRFCAVWPDSFLLSSEFEPMWSCGHV
jgi:hypothetical protein